MWLPRQGVGGDAWCAHLSQGLCWPRSRPLDPAAPIKFWGSLSSSCDPSILGVPSPV